MAGFARHALVVGSPPASAAVLYVLYVLYVLPRRLKRQKRKGLGTSPFGLTASLPCPSLASPPFSWEAARPFRKPQIEQIFGRLRAC